MTRLLLAALLVAGLAAVGVVAYALPRDDVPAAPDVVVALGGSGAERAQLGIELAERHNVPLVLSSSAAFYAEQEGLRCDRDALCFDPMPANTAGEARSVARMAEAEGWQEVVVTTTSHHSSRARFLFQQCLGRDRVRVLGEVRAGWQPTTPRLLARESLGLIAAATFARAC